MLISITKQYQFHRDTNTHMGDKSQIFRCLYIVMNAAVQFQHYHNFACIRSELLNEREKCYVYSLVCKRSYSVIVKMPICQNIVTNAVPRIQI